MLGCQLLGALVISAWTLFCMGGLFYALKVGQAFLRIAACRGQAHGSCQDLVLRLPPGHPCGGLCSRHSLSRFLPQRLGWLRISYEEEMAGLDAST